MATGHAVIPVGDEQFQSEWVSDYLEDEMLFFPVNLPTGRFPTLIELRHSIHELGYELEETHDWYVTSKDDFTEIWFRGENRSEDNSNEFWFRRGHDIVLHITQALANQCGSFAVFSHSGYPTILIVPDNVFPTSPQTQNRTGFFEVISSRFPIMLERLEQASPEDTLFILSQIRQAVRRADRFRQHEFFEVAQQGLSSYKRFLDDKDVRVRYMAFDLIATFKEKFYENAEILRQSIKNESVSEIKTRMLYAIEHLIVRGWIGDDIDQPTKAVLDLLFELSDNAGESPLVRLAATNLLARAQPGLLTPSMRTVFIDALVQPEKYELRWYSAYTVIEQTLKSIEKLLLNHRIEILVAALPEIAIAQYAHDVLRTLLDHVFFGATRATQMSSLLDTYTAERPVIDETKMREHLSRNWLYPANPTRLAAAELQPIQRKVLETVIAQEIPWMVHSNLLEKYGLPPTRASVQAMLETSQ